MARWLRHGAYALMGLTMAAMVWPAVPRWLSLAALAPAVAWFLGLATVRRRAADVHHAVMAACMVWMAVMPAMPGAACTGMTGTASDAAAGYFVLAAAPFITAPLRTGPLGTAPRATVLAPLGHGAMSLAMAVLLVAHH
jgi:hypothetical protein